MVLGLKIARRCDAGGFRCCRKLILLYFFYRTRTFDCAFQCEDSDEVRPSGRSGRCDAVKVACQSVESLPGAG